MEHAQPQMARPHDHGHHQYEQEPRNVGLEPVVEGDQEDEHHHEKKSVLKKVKAKAKKIKDTLKLHAHHDHDHADHQYHEGHIPDDHDLDEEDDYGDEEEDETVDDPETLGASAYEGAAIRSSVLGLGNSDAARNIVRTSLPGQEEDIGLPHLAVERNTDISEVPRVPMNTPASGTRGIAGQTEKASTADDTVRSSVRDQETTRGQPEVHLGEPMELEEDPHAPKDRPEDYSPSNYQSKVIDPTGFRGEEAGVGPTLRSFEKMNIADEPKQVAIMDKLPTGSHDQFSPELAPPKPKTSEDNFQSEPSQDRPRRDSVDKPSDQSSYTQKISSATSAIADKVISAKNVVASKLGYGEKDEAKEPGMMHEGQETTTTNNSASPVEYEKKIAATVTEKITPVYEKVAEAGSTVISKVHGHGTTTGPADADIDRTAGQDKGVSVKDYVAEKLKPGEEDRALSQLISEALNRSKVKTEKEGDRPMGQATESEEVKRRLGTADADIMESDSARVPGKTVVDKLKGTEGFSASDTGSLTGERKLQESGN